MLMAMCDGLAHYHITVFVLDYASSTDGHKNNKNMPPLSRAKICLFNLEFKCFCIYTKTF